MAKLHTIYNAEEKIWYGKKQETIYHPETSIGRVALNSLQKNANNIGQISETTGVQLTCGEIALNSVRAAQQYEKLGLTQDDVIGICSSNTDLITSAVIGAFLGGITISTLDPSFDREGIKHIFGITKPKLMLCDGKVYDDVKAVLKELNLNCSIYTSCDPKIGVHHIAELVEKTGNENEYEPPSLKYGGDQTAAILCSSGTTGLPKGVCVSHKALISTIALVRVTTSDVILSFSTLYWISGMFIFVLQAITGCIRIITQKPFSVKLFLEIVEKFKVSHIFGPPSQAALIVQSNDIGNYDVSSLRMYACGGSSIPFPVINKIKQHFKNANFVAGYGMTETCSTCSVGIPACPGDNGYLFPNIKVKIIDENEQNVGIGEQGEICIFPPFHWSGYYNNPKATKDIYDDEKWIHSGDLGYITEKGRLFIVDRKKDILKYKNFHYFPSEIEQVIAEIPDVIEVAVCGLPDDIVTDLPAAAIVKRSESNLTEEYIKDYVAQRMAHFKHLYGGVTFIDSMPKTASGKIIRHEVKKMLIRNR